MGERKTNPEIVAELRTLLTDGAREALGDGEMVKTKGWRSRLWKIANEIEERMDPLGAMAKRREKQNEQSSG